MLTIPSHAVPLQASNGLSNATAPVCDGAVSQGRAVVMKV
jgi:hypothetical protein